MSSVCVTVGGGESRSPDEVREWANYYATHSFSIFPVVPKSKRPALKWEQFQSQAATSEQAEAWFEGIYAGHNIGIVTGGVSDCWVLDVDVGNGKFGAESLAALIARYGELPATCKTVTGGGGTHLFFKMPPGTRVPNSKGKLGPDLDVRGDGGFVVAPPSIHENGNSYEWDRESLNGPMVRAPEWLENLVVQGGSAGLALPTQWMPQEPLAAKPEHVSSDYEHGVDGKITDGREDYAFKLLTANLREFVEDNNREPTAQELFDKTWPTYADKADLTREGRDADFFLGKCFTRLAAFRDGQIPGAESVAVVAANNPTVDGFQEFDPSIVKATRREPPPFPLHALGPDWAAWCKSVAENTSAPVDYVVAPLLATIAALAGNNFVASPFPSWNEPCILWTVAVGDPSSGKSPAAGPVNKAVSDLEFMFNRDFKDRWADYEAACITASNADENWRASVAMTNDDNVDGVDGGKKELPRKPTTANMPKKPELRRIRVGDATTEALIGILNANPNGILLQRDELAGWLAGMDRYNGGGDRQVWLESYGAGSYVVDRKGAKGLPLTVEKMSVSITGTTQPERLVDLVGAADDGLAARLLYFWPNGVRFNRPTRAIDNDFILQALRRIADVQPALDMLEQPYPRVLPFDLDAADMLVDWIGAVECQNLPPGLEGSAIGKSRGHVVRLSMVLEMMNWAIQPGADLPKSISAQSVESAIEMMEEYFKPMVARVAGDASQQPADRHAAAIARRIVRDRLTQINGSTVRRFGWAGTKDRKAVKAAFDELLQSGWLKKAEAKKGPGRKPDDFDVNPLAHAPAI